MRILFFLILLAQLPRVCCQNWNEVIKAVASDRGYEDRFGSSVAIDGDYAIIGSPNEDDDVFGNDSLNSSGSAYVFKNINGVWTEIQKLVASDRGTYDQFGNSVSISGDYILIGAITDGEDEVGGNPLNYSGSAYIFKKNGVIWEEEQKLVALDRSDNAMFGSSVSIDGDYAVIGAHSDGFGVNGVNNVYQAGSAYVFRLVGNTWVHDKKLVANDRGYEDYFGCTVSISSEYIIVGAYNEDQDVTGGSTLSGAGSVYVYRVINGDWVQSQKIVAKDRGAGDMFGGCVSVSNNYAIIGAANDYDDTSSTNQMGIAGSAYVFKLNDTIWVQHQKIIASDRGPNDRFGARVSISGDYAIITAVSDGDDALGGNPLFFAGSAYIFQRLGNVWEEEQKIVPSDRGQEDYFGYSAAISDGYSIIGAYVEDEDTSNLNTKVQSGSCYFFKGCQHESSESSIFECESYTWINGITYTMPIIGEYYIVPGATINGCDSVYVLNLTINKPTVSVINGSVIHASTVGADYQWLTCPSMVPISGATEQTYVVQSDGDYAVAVTQNTCTDTSNCITIEGLDVPSYLLNDVLIYPNPTEDLISIKLNNDYQDYNIMLLGIDGKIIANHFNVKSFDTYDLTKLKSGIYLIKIETTNFNNLFKVVKK